MYAFRPTILNRLPRMGARLGTIPAPKELPTDSPLHPSHGIWIPGMKSKSGKSGYDPFPAEKKSTRRHADMPVAQPTTLQEYNQHKKRFAHTPQKSAPQARIPLFHPDTPFVFLKFVRSNPALRLDTVATSLANIPGMHKIPLLKLLQVERMTKEAVLVYKALIQNGLVSRLGYADHHRQLHLLKADPLEFRPDIEACWRVLEDSGVLPARNLVSIMFSCALVWKDEAASWALYHNMTCNSTSFETEGFNDFVGNVQPNDEAVAVWNASIKSLTPTLKTIKRGLKLFGARGDSQGVDAVCAYEKEHRDYIAKDYENVIQKGRGANATSYTLSLNNSIMSTLIECGAYDKATRIFDGMCADAGTRFNSDTFNLMIRIASHEERISKIDQVFALFEERGVKADNVAYGKIIETCGRAGRSDLGVIWFNRSVDALRVEIGGRKWIGLSTCLVHCFVLTKEYKKAADLFKSMNGKGFRSTSRYGIAAYCGLGDVSEALDILERKREYFTIDYDEMKAHIVANAQESAERLIREQ